MFHKKKERGNSYLSVVGARLHVPQREAVIRREVQGEVPLAPLGHALVDMHAAQAAEQVHQLPGPADSRVQTEDHRHLRVDGSGLLSHHELEGWRYGTVEEALADGLKQLREAVADTKYSQQMKLCKLMGGSRLTAAIHFSESASSAGSYSRSHSSPRGGQMMWLVFQWCSS